MFLMFHLRPARRAAGRRPGHPQRRQVAVPAAKLPTPKRMREDRPPLAPLPDAGLPLPLELAGQHEPGSRPGGARGQAASCRTSARRGCAPPARNVLERRVVARAPARRRARSLRRRSGSTPAAAVRRSRPGRAVAAADAVELDAAWPGGLDRVERLVAAVRSARGVAHVERVANCGPCIQSFQHSGSSSSRSSARASLTRPDVDRSARSSSSEVDASHAVPGAPSSRRR